MTTRSPKAVASAAGMTLVRGDEERLGSPVAAAPILAPTVVEVDLGQVVYGFVGARGGYEPARWVDPASPAAYRLLDSFVELATGESDDDEVVKLVRNWGALGLCPHHLPVGHNPPPRYAVAVTQGAGWWCLPLGYGDARFQAEMSKRHGAEVAQWGYEPISRWRDFARSASALLLVAAALRSRVVPAPPDTREAFAFWGLPDAPLAVVPAEKRAEVGWRLLVDAMNGWLSLAGLTVNAAFRRDTNGLSMDTRWVTGWESRRATGSSAWLPGGGIVTGQVFGVLALQLLLRIGRNRDIGVCAWCRRPFLSADRRLRPDRRHFCERCQREKRPDLMAQRDKRERDRRREREGT